MNTTQKIRRNVVAAGLLLVLGSPLVACTAVGVAAATPTPVPTPGGEPLWRTAPHWSQLRPCADDRVASGAADTFDDAWRDCVSLMLLAQPAESGTR